mmetsp:Transcript_35870/g.52612  ORF Transcript_35870/g.52612 Transcript_35870/m.52612 type:complete len:83 (-) Transcript_35870:126-374(-)
MGEEYNEKEFPPAYLAAESLGPRDNWASAMSTEGVLQVTASYLVAYQKWWMNLLTEDPVHLSVETPPEMVSCLLLLQKKLPQ